MIEGKEGTESLAGLLRTRGYEVETDNTIVRIPSEQTPLKSLKDAQIVKESGYKAIGFDGNCEWFAYAPVAEVDQ